MGWRSEIEDKYTVACKKCGHGIVDPEKLPRQKFILNQPCPRCGHVRRTG